MESSTAQSTPEKTPRLPLPGARRSFTVPARLEPLRASSPGAGDVETLYNHWFAKVVTFTTAAASSRRDSAASAALSENDEVGTLPWTYPTERTMAAGPLRVYRVPNSVAFLNSGSLLHPILPKSQCWCVDGEAKFVLRIRLNSYYRIEFPFESDEEKTKVEDFKGVINTVLQYEKTRCPFQRGFVVELPERPTIPVRRKSRYSSERVKRWKFDKVWEREDTERRQQQRQPDASDAGSICISEEDDDTASVITTSTRDESFRDESPRPSPRLETTSKVVPKASLDERKRAFLGARSVSASPNLGPSTGTPPPSQSAQPKVVEEAVPAPATPQRTLSHTPSMDSFYSFERTLSSPSVYDDAVPEHDDAELGRVSSYKRQEPGLTVTTGIAYEAEDKTPTAPSSDGRPSSAPSTPTLMSDSEDSFEPPLPDVPTPPDTIRLRRLHGASQRRAFSPMPSAVNLFTPSKQQQNRHLTTLLVQKTCSILLGPPAHLVALMLRIASKIAAGTFGLDSYYLGRGSQRIPGTWESSGEEDEWDEDEDDFGIALSNVGSGAEQERGGQNLCEVD